MQGTICLADTTTRATLCKYGVPSRNSSSSSSSSGSSSGAVTGQRKNSIAPLPVRHVQWFRNGNIFYPWEMMPWFAFGNWGVPRIHQFPSYRLPYMGIPFVVGPWVKHHHRFGNRMIVVVMIIQPRRLYIVVHHCRIGTIIPYGFGIWTIWRTARIHPQIQQRRMWIVTRIDVYIFYIMAVP